MIDRHQRPRPARWLWPGPDVERGASGRSPRRAARRRCAARCDSRTGARLHRPGSRPRPPPARPAPRHSSSRAAARPDFVYDRHRRRRRSSSTARSTTDAPRRAATRRRRPNPGLVDARLERHRGPPTTTTWATLVAANPSVVRARRRVDRSTTATSVRTVGSLVRARGRDWVVLPDSDARLPGPAAPRRRRSTTSPASSPRLEHGRRPRTFPPPTADDLGDDRSARPAARRPAHRLPLHRRARSAPWPGIAVEPRPYQLVPLLMALRQDTVRLLIADDVGIGKTIEAGLIAARAARPGRRRSGWRCSARPAWPSSGRRELREQVRHRRRAGAASHRRPAANGAWRMDESLFDRHPFTSSCPPTSSSPTAAATSSCALPRAGHRRRGPHRCRPTAPARTAARTQRYELLRDLAADADRHLVLVTATPHSGKETALPQPPRPARPGLSAHRRPRSR